MKNRVIFLVLLYLPFFGCTSASESLEVDPQSLVFADNETSVSFDIVSNAKWELTCSDWLKCSPDKGEGNRSVRATATINNQYAARTGSITVSTPTGKSQTVQVTQPGREPSIDIDPVSASVSASGRDITVYVSASSDWTAQIPDNAKPWVSVKPQTATQATLTVAPNTSETERSAVIAFKVDGTDRQASFSLSQSGYAGAFTVDPQTKSITDASGEVTVTVTSGRTWTATIPSADTWIKVKLKTTDHVVFSVEENLSGAERKSNIVFQLDGDDKPVTFVLTQEKGYALMTSMNPGAAQAGMDYSQLNVFMSPFGFDYTENPQCTGIGGHNDGVHLAVEQDNVLNQYVFRFDIHITPVIDGDRCGDNVDRQRNEMKSATNNTTWAKVQGNWDEWQRLEWKFKLPVGFQPTSSFCHIHQIKGQDGPNISSPVITITPRANSNGSNKRMQIIHTVDGANPGAGIPAGLGTVVDNIPLADFEGEWVQVVEEIHYLYDGYYSVKITRIRDGKVLLTYSNNTINMWRSGSSYLRNKYGIYRSLAGGDLTQNPVGQSTLLKNESVWMCDFKIYEKNTNPNPTQTH